ncbi:DUF2975 domain-containing protein [Stigmatella sp. ncwal1]|uniref:DUF2975 domain-containing protein n=1 Tax=Stigmatella ashevillensis TaxID=2995309 RepID=A0ABT5DDT2_9BACT|nr:DUF2975 domain-containing protein [Stigmatella ashevillena]MDC0711840.1 DUF2975 domain-containing protein [Stigmatella ashevillena]
MTSKTMTARIRTRSGRLCRAMTLLVALLSVLLVLERFSAVTLALYRDGGAEPARRLAQQGVAAIPEVFYLLALWWIRQALAAFARGEFYTPTLTRALSRVGVMLATGALLGVFIVPSVMRVLGFEPGYVIAYDVGGLVLGAVGLALTLLANVLTHAFALQSELEEIF